MRKELAAALVFVALIPAAASACDASGSKSGGSKTISVPTTNSQTGEICAGNGKISVAGENVGKSGQITVVNFGNPIPDIKSVDVTADDSQGLACADYSTQGDTVANESAAIRNVVGQVRRSTNAPASEPERVYNFS